MISQDGGMGNEEREELLSMGRDYQTAMNGDHEPMCIARAFARQAKPDPLAFTMQRWIDLEAVRSPLLSFGYPDAPEQIAEALAAFDLVDDGIGAEALVDLFSAMHSRIARGFAGSLKMNPPGESTPKEPDGFGGWLPLLSFLMTQCRLSFNEALAIHVERALMLAAAIRLREGWKTAGKPYALRETDFEVSTPTEK